MVRKGLGGAAAGLRERGVEHEQGPEHDDERRRRERAPVQPRRERLHFSFLEHRKNEWGVFEVWNT